MNYLVIRMIDNWSKICIDRMGGVGTISQRIIRIPLTEQQLELLTPKPVGADMGKPVYEERELLTIEEELTPHNQKG